MSRRTSFCVRCSPSQTWNSLELGGPYKRIAVLQVNLESLLLASHVTHRVHVAICYILKAQKGFPCTCFRASVYYIATQALWVSASEGVLLRARLLKGELLPRASSCAVP